MDKLKAAIGDRVRLLREETTRTTGKDFSQYDLARELTDTSHEVKQGQIGHIESGRRLPSVELLVAMAEFFGTSLDYLTGRTTNSSSIAAIDEDLQTGGISGRLGALYKNLPDTMQDELYRFAQALSAMATHERGGTPKISPPPLTRRQQISIAMQRLLDSIEVEHGTDTREEVERLLRARGVIIDRDS